MVDLGECKIVRYELGTKYPNNLTHLLWIWETIKALGKTEPICPTMHPDEWGAEGFLRSIAGEYSHFWQVFQNRELLGFVWIQNHKPKRAEIHFGVVKFDRNYLKICRKTINYLMNFYDLEVFYGYVPAHNLSAIKFMRKIGANITGVIPNGSYKYSEDAHYDSVLFTYLREKNE